MKLRFLSVAAQELAEARDYYESISPDLARRFIAEIRAVLSRIRSNPMAWARMGGENRRCRTSRFPYGLIYTVRTDGILIVAVAHLHRDPEHWRDLLERS